MLTINAADTNAKKKKPRSSDVYHKIDLIIDPEARRGSPDEWNTLLYQLSKSY